MMAARVTLEPVISNGQPALMEEERRKISYRTYLILHEHEDDYPQKDTKMTTLKKI